MYNHVHDDCTLYMSSVWRYVDFVEKKTKTCTMACIHVHVHVCAKVLVSMLQVVLPVEKYEYWALDSNPVRRCRNVIVSHCVLGQSALKSDANSANRV